LPYTVDRKILGPLAIAVVVATSAIVSLYVNAPGCTACEPATQVTGERISLYSVYVNSSTLVTLTVRNIGTVQTTLVSYVANESASQPYTSNGWSGPTLAPNAVTNLALAIDGKAFTFQTGKIYNIVLVSSTNKHWQFTFTV
jgi:hypothetical protein